MLKIMPSNLNYITLIACSLKKYELQEGQTKWNRGRIHDFQENNRISVIDPRNLHKGEIRKDAQG